MKMVRSSYRRREEENGNSSSSEMNMNMNMNSNMNEMVKPAWLEGIMAETSFFRGCGVHENRRKNEKNVFCLLCCLTICPHCLPSHTSHPLLQVRRYVYNDVIRLSDLERLIDCSYIQPYTINGAKVIFLKERPQSRAKDSANVCFTCDRILQDPFHFCSLSCKVNHLVYQGEDLSGILYRIDESDFAFSQFEGDSSDQLEYEAQLNSGPMLEDQMQFKGENIPGMSNQPEVVVKKKKSSRFLPGIVLSLSSSRRKGAPQRSPLS